MTVFWYVFGDERAEHNTEFVWRPDSEAGGKPQGWAGLAWALGGQTVWTASVWVVFSSTFF